MGPNQLMLFATVLGILLRIDACDEGIYIVKLKWIFIFGSLSLFNLIFIALLEVVKFKA